MLQQAYHPRSERANSDASYHQQFWDSQISSLTTRGSRESLRSAISRKLLGPPGQENWGKQKELERALKAIDSIQKPASHYKSNDKVMEREGSELDAVFSQELMELRAQFEKVRRADSGRHQRQESRCAMKVQVYVENDEVYQVESTQEHTEKSSAPPAAKCPNVFPVPEEIPFENDNFFDYELPSEFLEGLERMMASSPLR